MLAPSADLTLWLVALAIGAVVILVVIVLLTMLVLLLRDTDASVAALAAMARTAEDGSRGEATTELENAASIAEDLEREILLHRDLLAGR